MSKTIIKNAGYLSDKSIARIRAHLIRRNKIKLQKNKKNG
tara:strand:- start:114 stop:233 length:120 start_codon:yes stop_codon:yes gene_type:complete